MSHGTFIELDSPARSELLRSLRAAEDAEWRKTLWSAFYLLILSCVALGIHYLTPMSWNVAATRALQSVSTPALSELMRLISGFGNAPKLITVMVVALVACGQTKKAVGLTISGLGGWLMSIGLKEVFSQPRPSPELVTVFHQWPDGSFPSGHIAFYLCCFGFLFITARAELPPGSILRRGVMIFTVAMISLAGVSRVYLGEHWISDLPGSYLLGAIWLALSLKLYRRFLDSSS